MNYWVNILQSSADQFYAGQTDNLDRRLISRNSTDIFAAKFMPEE
jgi:predicted GIY-YIG superfamily endonuclease